ncbi:hypothetical protein R1sor_008546 [Riccia sorocarpa]|uniref:tRNA-dihydrouridine(47) synthase [NAD(P)(+)] n=1 Tax=Riccia sorocarpa TaxID=122646 RepID=A0ABD3HXS1_9MARC
MNSGNGGDLITVMEFSQQQEFVSSAEDMEGRKAQADGIGDVEMKDANVGQEVSPTVEELVAKARAPVKKEFLVTAGVRVLSSHGGVTAGPERGAPPLSKRQMKKSRNQAKKSAKSICAMVAKTMDPSKCPYGDKCLFNHNVEVYLEQKPPDLPGNCPSLEIGEPCSYSITCRFAGTHKNFSEVEKKPPNVPTNERNILRKDLQKLLWKNKGQYPRADAQLRAMGLMGKAFKLNSAQDEEMKGLADEGITRPITVDAEANGDSESHTKDSSSTLEVNGDEALLPTSVTSSHPSKRPKTSTNGTAAEATGDSKSCLLSEGECKTGSVMVVDLATNASGVATAEFEPELEPEGLVPDQLLQDKETVKPSANKDSWRRSYFEAKLSPREKKLIDFRDKLYLAPLTTVGNLPFRRVCKNLGADITCGEMAMCRNLLQGAASEWALLRRHSSEDIFGVQICGGFPDHVARTAELIERECEVDFIDVNIGCPIDLVVNSGAGSCLLTKPQRLEQIVRATAGVMESPLTLKLRMGYYEGRNCAHSFIPDLYDWGVSAVTVHGRTRQQRYSKVANWDYINECASAAPEKLQVIGNGDIMAYTDWDEHLRMSGSKLTTCMIARGALMKPWLFTEIKEGRHWDISSGERLDILRQYVNAGLTHWGSDDKGVEVTRKFLLEWLSYMHRYIPVGLLEVVPQRLNWRPPSYFGRNDLESLMASESALDWIRISEMLLGPVPPHFVFQPKHKSNAYDRAENG